jgi:hypothetical protein
MIARHVEIIEESNEILMKTKNFKTKIGRIETIKSNVDILENEYLSKGIVIKGIHTDQIMSELNDMFNLSVEEEALRQSQKHMDKARVVKTATAKINNANKSLLVLKDFKDEYGYENPEMIKEIGFFIFESQLNEYITKAEKEEFKGNHKKSLDAYLDALFFVENEKVSNQEMTIRNLNEKIKTIREKQNIQRRI